MSSERVVYTPVMGLRARSGQDDSLNAIIETPKGSRNKYKYEVSQGLFRLENILPAGAVFPFDYGFIPETLGQDGDPLDVLILMDEPAFVGCLLTVRMLGVIEMEQTEAGQKIRNDRLIGVASISLRLRATRSLDQLGAETVRELEHFLAPTASFRAQISGPLAAMGQTGRTS